MERQAARVPEAAPYPSGRERIRERESNVNQSYVSCASCGHQFPEHFVRRRRSVECSCGLRIDIGPALRTNHHLRNLLFLFATAILLVGAAAIGRHFVG